MLILSRKILGRRILNFSEILTSTFAGYIPFYLFAKYCFRDGKAPSGSFSNPHLRAPRLCAYLGEIDGGESTCEARFNEKVSSLLVHKVN